MSLPSYSTVRGVPREVRVNSASANALRSFSEPFFAVYDDAFLSILGLQPRIQLVLEKDYPFAHEAGAYVPKQDAVYITSNQFKPPGASDKTIWVSKVERRDDGSGSWSHEKLETAVEMGNGGINYRSGILFCDQGSKTQPGGLVLMQSKPPYNTSTLVDGFHGRLFNSVNDVAIHSDGSIWFTDPIYGYEQGFRDKPQLPCHVYCFDPTTGDVRMVADNFGRPNGLCFSPDEKQLYVTDTDIIHGDGTIDPTRASTIYCFDVIKWNGSMFLLNRMVFAMADNGFPDGIKCDLDGNVYSGCGDGINVWNSGGVLIGKIMVPGGVANFCFAKKGEIIVLNETRMWVVTVSSKVQGALLANMGIDV